MDGVASSILMAVVSLIIGAAISWYFARNVTLKKTLGYQEVSSISLVSIDKQISREVEIYYRQTLVKNVQSIVLSFKNIGSSHIESEDFAIAGGQYPTIEFNPEATILSLRIEDDPQNIVLESNYSGSTQAVFKALFYKKSHFTVSILVSNFNEYKVVGRGSGVESIGKIPSLEALEMRKISYFVSVVALLILVLMTLFSIPLTEGGTLQEFVFETALLPALVVISILVPFIFAERRRDSGTSLLSSLKKLLND